MNRSALISTTDALHDSLTCEMGQELSGAKAA